MKILVTGYNKGLGDYIANHINGTVLGFCRGVLFNVIKEYEYDLIVHCAFNSRSNPPSNELNEYFEDNIILTYKLINEIVSKRFVFISSIDVYPDDMEFKHEERTIDINDVRTIYGKCKLACEDMVNRHNNHLILRCGGIIGENKFPKSIDNILKDGRTSLSKESEVNYISQKTILDIINVPDVKNQIVNVASDTSMKIIEMEEIAKPISYGNYKYTASHVMTDKLKKLFPQIKIPSSKYTLFDVLKDKYIRI